MQYLRHIPGPPLGLVVQHLWSLRDAPGHAMERVLPSGTLELVVNLDEDELRVYRDGACSRFAGAVVSGAYRQCFAIDSREHASIMGVHFRPGGAYAVLGVPPGTLADQHVELEALWPRFGRELRAQLCSAATPSARFALLERALNARMVSRRGPHAAAMFALDQLGHPNVTVGAVALHLQLSRRRLIELFTAEIGMTPKRMSRVLRLQRMLSQARQVRTPAWAQLANACGYFDQSHLINEVRLLTGMSPTELIGASAHVKDNHVAIADAGNKLPRPARRRGPR
jgi:AraC-like DNA-binding protein